MAKRRAKQGNKREGGGNDNSGSSSGSSGGSGNSSSSSSSGSSGSNSNSNRSSGSGVSGVVAPVRRGSYRKVSLASLMAGASKKGKGKGEEGGDSSSKSSGNERSNTNKERQEHLENESFMWRACAVVSLLCSAEAAEAAVALGAVNIVMQLAVEMTYSVSAAASGCYCY